MRANAAKNLLLPLLAGFTVAPVLAADAAPGTPSSAVAQTTAPTAVIAVEPQAAAGFASMPIYPVWPHGMVPLMRPMPYALPFHPAMAGGMLVVVPIQGFPGMPVPPTWFPVGTVPMPQMAPVAVPAAGGVDYGPVSDAPVVELPLPAEASVPPAIEPGAALVPADAPGGAAATASDAAEPPWTESAVDYGPVTPTPVVDLLAPQATPAAPPPVSKTPRSGAKAKTPAKGAAAPRKNRMCWENGVVAPCK